MSDPIKDMSDPEVSPAERYERGLALKQAGLHKAAIDQFEMAAVDLPLAVKAYAQMGLCSIHSDIYIAAYYRYTDGRSPRRSCHEKTGHCGC